MSRLFSTGEANFLEKLASFFPQFRPADYREAIFDFSIHRQESVRGHAGFFPNRLSKESPNKIHFSVSQ